LYFALLEGLRDVPSGVAPSAGQFISEDLGQDSAEDYTSVIFNNKCRCFLLAICRPDFQRRLFRRFRGFRMTIISEDFTTNNSEDDNHHTPPARVAYADAKSKLSLLDMKALSASIQRNVEDIIRASSTA
jgi:hypothetical protein